MNPEILTFLVRGGKISMPDHIKRGLWPHLPMTEEVFSHPEAAAYSVEWYLHLSGDLEAWRVIE